LLKIGSLDSLLDTCPIKYSFASYYSHFLQTVLRVFECFLNEGTKILYRVALAILKILQKDILSLKTKEEVSNFLNNISSKKLDCEDLIKVAFKFRLSRTNVAKLNNKNGKAVPNILTRYSKSEADVIYYRPSVSFSNGILNAEQVFIFLV
jgi:hypothetical protein